jgi:DNA-directed RNA polymerase subunit RPC12/RpoP
MPVLLLTSLAWLTGCGKPAKPAAAAAEVAGYLCSSCKGKFYVEQTVVPEFCPQCKGTGLQQLLGYVCATDGHLTLNIRRSKPLPCEQCGMQTSSFRRPTTAELEAWGALKKEKADVCRQ